MTPLKRVRNGFVTVFVGCLAIAPLVSSAPAQAATGGSWPQFRHDAAKTGFNPAESTLGVSNVGGLRLLWHGSVPPGSQLLATPSVAGGRVYLPAFGGGLHAWSEADGRPLWTADTGTNLVESTPAIAHARVFVEENDGPLEAFAAWNGSQRWSGGDGSFGSPTVWSGMVFSSDYSGILAFDALSGALIWDSTLPGGFGDAVAVSRGRVFVSSRFGVLYALDAATGNVLWRRQHIGSVDLATPVVGRRTVYLCTETGLHAFYVRHGYRRWTRAGVCDADSTPAFAEGVLYADGHDETRLSAVSSQDGTVLWSVGTTGAWVSGPVIANGVVYVTMADGTVVAFATSGGHAQLWKSPDESFMSAPTIANGRLYAGTPDGVYAFGL